MTNFEERLSQAVMDRQGSVGDAWLTRAVELVRNAAVVATEKDGVYKVSTTNGDVICNLPRGHSTCHCTIAQRDKKSGKCLHKISAELCHAIISMGYGEPDVDEGDIAVEPRENTAPKKAPQQAILHGAVMTDAPFSANLYANSPEGWNVQFSIRTQESVLLLDEIAELTDWLNARGWTPPIRNKVVMAKPPKDKLPVPKDNLSDEPEGLDEIPFDDLPEVDVPPSLQKQEKVPNSALAFDAGFLEGTTRNDKTYWKVKGPRFHKWGITVWPEVLDDAGLTHEDQDLTGWTAIYIENEDGNPLKVIKLVKPSAV